LEVDAVDLEGGSIFIIRETGDYPIKENIKDVTYINISDISEEIDNVRKSILKELQDKSDAFYLDYNHCFSQWGASNEGQSIYHHSGTYQ